MEMKNYSVIKISQELLTGQVVTEEKILEAIEKVGRFFSARYDQKAYVVELKRRNNVH
ncbi:hypothetical protein [Nitrosomonas sp. Nm166]|uniref:hypothetical protein n=1 Tax=Nitrosomonas sp. Nm166 TaxID=1881054 RepID=UPI0008DF1EDD|nr:hypothetical protein [Nitrosomonas sp. Nm166]SFF19103.1 hypothetical protein SAMN05428977_10673 [Nitrosomonas sp. Nm166]